MSKNSYIIAGPTASGKSDFAHALAKRISGVVINADSVQIYRGIENISASPMAGNSQEIDGVPYRLFSILPLGEQISVADYLEMARREYDDAIAKGQVPIFVGGSGFYINALVNGISPMPEVSPANRRRAREMIKNGATLPDGFIMQDPQRSARSLEVFLETGRPLSEWQKQPRRGAIVPTPFKILINPSRDELRDRIATRVPQMISAGALDEARAVIAAGWDEKRAIGASELCKVMRGEENMDTAIANWVTRTNQYAKRQQTWFRGQYAADLEIKNVPTDQDVDLVISA